MFAGDEGCAVNLGDRCTGNLPLSRGSERPIAFDDLHQLLAVR